MARRSDGAVMQLPTPRSPDRASSVSASSYRPSRMRASTLLAAAPFWRTPQMSSPGTELSNTRPAASVSRPDSSSR